MWPQPSFSSVWIHSAPSCQNSLHKAQIWPFPFIYWTKSRCIGRLCRDPHNWPLCTSGSNYLPLLEYISPTYNCCGSCTTRFPSPCISHQFHLPKILSLHSFLVWFWLVLKELILLPSPPEIHPSMLPWTLFTHIFLNGIIVIITVNIYVSPFQTMSSLRTLTMSYLSQDITKCLHPLYMCIYIMAF